LKNGKPYAIIPTFPSFGSIIVYEILKILGELKKPTMDSNITNRTKKQKHKIDQINKQLKKLKKINKQLKKLYESMVKHKILKYMNPHKSTNN